MKASELSPRTHHRLAQIFIEAGVPPAAVNVIQTRREDAPAVTEALIAHKAIKKVEFVGSAAVGSIVGSLAGKYLKPVLMELGGKCSAIVLDDADLDDAAGKCIAGGSLTFYSPSAPHSPSSPLGVEHSFYSLTRRQRLCIMARYASPLNELSSWRA